MRIRFQIYFLCFLSACGEIIPLSNEEKDSSVDSDSSFIIFNDASIIDDSSIKNDARILFDLDACPYHDDGVGHKYKSCYEFGTFNFSSANLACKSYLHALDAGGTCVGNPTGNCRGFDGTMVGTIDTPARGFWDFGGPAAGHMTTSDSGCPQVSDPTWN